MNTIDRPDLFEGERLRDRGISVVITHNPSWTGRFHEVAARLLGERSELTSLDVLLEIGEPEGSPNAIGAAMRTFARRHGLRITGYRKSERPSRHAAIVAVWGGGL